jgi:hypothetical protein
MRFERCRGERIALTRTPVSGLPQASTIDYFAVIRDQGAGRMTDLSVAPATRAEFDRIFDETWDDDMTRPKVLPSAIRMRSGERSGVLNTMKRINDAIAIVLFGLSLSFVAGCLAFGIWFNYWPHPGVSLAECEGDLERLFYNVGHRRGADFQCVELKAGGYAMVDQMAD